MIFSTKQHEAVHIYLLMLFCFFLPIHPRIAVLVINLLALNWLVSGAIFKNFKHVLNPLSLLLMGFYFLHVLTLLYTSDFSSGLSKAETKLPLLVFPLLLFSFPLKKSKTFFSFLKSYILGCLAASGYSFLHAFYNYSQDGLNWFYYKYLSSFLGFHPTYFSMYLSFAFFVVLFFLIKNRKNYSLQKNILFVFICGWFFLFILLLASRMTILATSLIGVISFLVFMFLEKKIVKGIIFSVFAIVLLIVATMNLPGLEKRTTKTMERIENQYNNIGVSDPRVNIWKATIEVIQENPIRGTGLGSEQLHLSKVYQKNNFDQSLQEKFNTHNQYLQTILSLGVIGGLLLLLNLFVPFYLAIRYQDYLFIFFLAIISLSFLTESVLEAERGTLFFGFFMSLLAANFLFEKMKKTQ